MRCLSRERITMSKRNRRKRHQGQPASPANTPIDKAGDGSIVSPSPPEAPFRVESPVVDRLAQALDRLLRLLTGQATSNAGQAQVPSPCADINSMAGSLRAVADHHEDQRRAAADAESWRFRIGHFLKSWLSIQGVVTLVTALVAAIWAELLLVFR